MAVVGCITFIPDTSSFLSILLFLLFGGLFCTAHLEGFMLDDKSVFGLLKKETSALKKQFAKPR